MKLEKGRGEAADDQKKGLASSNTTTMLTSSAYILEGAGAAIEGAEEEEEGMARAGAASVERAVIGLVRQSILAPSQVSRLFHLCPRIKAVFETFP